MCFLSFKFVECLRMRSSGVMATRIQNKLYLDKKPLLLAFVCERRIVSVIRAHKTNGSASFKKIKRIGAILN